jgi:hypothetical protein
VRFPLDRPVPEALVGRIAKYRAAEVAKVKPRKAAKKSAARAKRKVRAKARNLATNPRQ